MQDMRAMVWNLKVVLNVTRIMGMNDLNSSIFLKNSVHLKKIK